MAYGTLKADTLIYDNSGDQTITVQSLAGKADSASPTFTGTPAAPTAAANTNTTQIATTAYVQSELGDYATLAAPALTGNATGVNLTLSGTLTVNGSTTTVASTNTTVADNLLELNSGATSNANDSGIIIERGSTGDNAIFAWDESADKFIVGTTTGTADSTGDITIAAAALVASTVEDSKGDLRNIPINSQTSGYTLVASDAGKVVATTTGGWTIPASVFTTVGQTVTLLNNSGSAQNITASALTYLYNTADGANIKANTIALGARAMATIWFDGGATGYIQSSKITVS
tara:strand:- start:543 stop:1412 length:870 start_codon:yes stop_codon:yes gene_type:complete